jgi:hypothetical protein
MLTLFYLLHLIVILIRLLAIFIAIAIITTSNSLLKRLISILEDAQQLIIILARD